GSGCVSGRPGRCWPHPCCSGRSACRPPPGAGGTSTCGDPQHSHNTGRAWAGPPCIILNYTYPISSADRSVRHEFFVADGDWFVFAGGEEILGEVRAGEGAFDEIAVEFAQDVAEIAVGQRLDAVEDLLVALLEHNALLQVALAVAEAEQLFED